MTSFCNPTVGLTFVVEDVDRFEQMLQHVADCFTQIATVSDSVTDQSALLTQVSDGNNSTAEAVKSLEVNMNARLDKLETTLVGTLERGFASAS